MVPPVVGLLNTTAAVDEPLHNTWLATAFTVAIGFTVMVKFIAVPIQPLAVVGLTVIVAVVALVRLLAVVNDGILPVPLAANPIDGLLFTQLYTVPDTGLVNTIGTVTWLAHKVSSATGSTDAVGFTVMLNVSGVPTQLTPLFVKVGVTVIDATTGVVVLLVATNVGMLPLPLAAIPIEGALFVQL